MTDVTTPTTVMINGVDVTAYIELKDIEVEQAISEGATSSSASFHIHNGGGLALNELQPVAIYDTDTSLRFFGGRIFKLTEISNGVELDYDVECVDYAWDMSHPEDLDSTTYTDKDDSYIIHAVMDACCPSIDSTTFVDTVYSAIPTFETERSTPYDVVAKLAKAAGANWYVDFGPSSTARADATELIANEGFETAGAGGADVFASWTEAGDDGTIADETSVVYAGSHACKITCGATTGVSGARVYQQFAVVPGARYSLSFYTRGDGTNAGRYVLYDQSNGVFLIDRADTGITGTSYSYRRVFFIAPTGCTTIAIRLYGPPVDGGTAYFDSVSCQRMYDAYLHYFPSSGESADELLSNAGFETPGAGGTDVFANWTEVAGNGTIADEGTLVHAGSHACKITTGADQSALVRKDASAVSGRNYTLSFYTRGDGTYAGRYRIYAMPVGENIVAITSTGVTGTDYTLVSVDFTTPYDCATIRVILYGPETPTGIAYFDDVSLKLDYDAPYDLSDTPDTSGWTNYTKLSVTKQAPTANRIIVYGSGTIKEICTIGSETDYGGWITTSLVDSNISTSAQAQEYGYNTLERLASNPGYACSVYRPGLIAGMKIGLTNAARGLSNEQLLIYRITTRFLGGGYAQYDLQLGRAQERLSELLAKATGGAGGIGGLGAEYETLKNYFQQELEEYEKHTHYVSATAADAGAHTHTTGDTGSAGSHTHAATGTTNEVGSHTHTSGDTGSGGSHTHSVVATANSAGAHTHTTGDTGSAGSHTHAAGDTGSAGSHTHTTAATGSAGSHTHTTAATGSAGSHTHTTGDTGSAGSHTHTLTPHAHKINSCLDDFVGRTDAAADGHYHTINSSTKYLSLTMTNVLTGTCCATELVGAAGAHTHTGGDAASAGSHTHTGGDAASAGSHTHTGGDAASAGSHTHTGGDAASAGGHTHTGGDAASAGSHTHTGGDAASAGGHTHTGGDAASAGSHTHFVAGGAGDAGSHTHAGATIGDAGSHTHVTSGDAASAGGHTHTGGDAASAGSHTHIVGGNTGEPT